MTFIADRDALAKALAVALAWDWEAEPGVPSVAEVCADIADAIFSSGKVREVSTLADDEALVKRVAQTWAGAAWAYCTPTRRQMDESRNHLRALAAALTERSQ